MKSLTPNIFVRDIENSINYYKQLGFELKLHARIKDKTKLIKAPGKTFYGATEFSIQDPNGYILTFAEEES